MSPPLDAVKRVVSDFIMKREGDRIGLVVFGTHAFTQVPLTRDYNTIAFMLDHLKIGAAGPIPRLAMPWVFPSSAWKIVNPNPTILFAHRR